MSWKLCFHPRAKPSFEVDLGENYDVVLVPNFLHHFDPPTWVTFLKRVRSALRSDSRAAIVEFVPNPDRVTSPEAASFSLVMLATTAAGDAYTFEEFTDMQSRRASTRRSNIPCRLRSRRR
jgi:hypothetical protein